MEETKRFIVDEAMIIIAGHYKTTVYEVAKAIKDGNIKLEEQLNSLCERTLEACYDL